MRVPALAFLLVSPLGAQDPLVKLSANYRLVFENARVRVIDVPYAAHEKLPAHDHPATPTIYVYLTDSGPDRFSHTEGGTFRFSPRSFGEA